MFHPPGAGRLIFRTSLPACAGRSWRAGLAPDVPAAQKTRAVTINVLPPGIHLNTDIKSVSQPGYV